MCDTLLFHIIRWQRLRIWTIELMQSRRKVPVQANDAKLGVKTSMKFAYRHLFISDDSSLVCTIKSRQSRRKDTCKQMTPSLALEAAWTLRFDTAFLIISDSTSLVLNFWIDAVMKESFNACKWRQAWRYKQHELYVLTLLFSINSDDTSLN